MVTNGKKSAVALARPPSRCYNIGMKSIFKKHQRFGWVDGLAIVLVIIILISAVSWVIRTAANRSLAVVEAEYQTFTTNAAAEALVIRGEHLISAPTAGYFKPYYEEGSKVAAGSPIGAMSNDPDGEGTRDVNSGAFSGTVSYKLDGWEEILNDEALDSMDRGALIDLYKEGSVDANAENDLNGTASGRTVAKIIDNFQGCHILLWLDEPPHPFVSDGCATFTYETGFGPSEPLRAEVEENGMLEDGRYYLLLNVPSIVTEMTVLRHLNCQLQGSTVSGVLLPEKAVVIDEDGLTGVWVVANQQLEFRYIEITGRHDGDYLTDDIIAGTLIVTAPDKAKEGMKYKG